MNPFVKIIRLAFFIFYFLVLYIANCDAFTKEEVDEFLKSKLLYNCSDMSRMYCDSFEIADSKASSSEQKKLFKNLFYEQKNAFQLTNQAMDSLKSKDFDLSLSLFKKASKIYFREGCRFRYRYYVPDFFIGEIYEYKGNIKEMRNYYLRFLKNHKEISGKFKTFSKFIDDDYEKRIYDKFLIYNLPFNEKTFFIDWKLITTNIIIVVTFIFAVSFIWWALGYTGIAILPFVKKPDAEFFEQINRIENTLDNFKIQYSRWIAGEKYEKLDFLESIYFGFGKKEIKKYFPKKVVKEIIKICDLIKDFNSNKLDIEKHKTIRSGNISFVEYIISECEKCRKRYLK